MNNLGYLIATVLVMGMLLIKEKKILEENKEAQDEQEENQRPQGDNP